ncbi:phosphate ABC transporter substrate-binding protein [Eubacteriaceae bacterium ES3]|nr:phosphate ABC transporter substrate-binding protein [Eubacteriaceae bacterium ES3]
MTRKLKTVLVSLLVGASVMAFAGCGSSSSTDSSSSDSAGIAGEINGGGSTSVQHIIDAAGSEFSALNPDVTFTYSGTGSSDGVKGATEGTYSFGCASRELKAEEEMDNLTAIEFAYDGIAVVVNPANGVTALTSEQITSIYKGEITNWSEVGGADAPIVVVSREDGSGTRGAFEELMGFEDQLKADATVKEGNGNVQTTVAGNENAIGYVSLTYVDDTINAVTVDGTECTVDNIKSGTYPVARPFLIMYLEDSVDDATLAFIDYLMTEEGQAIVEENGAISVL